jgi:hypothetical protein
MKPVGLALCAVAAQLNCAAPAASQQREPEKTDVVALIRCEAAVQDYNGFAFWLIGEPSAADSLGWREVESGNPFLREFRLSAPVSVFGMQTDAIVFTATGPMAVLDTADAEMLAATLGLTPEINSGGKFLADKIVSDVTDTSDGITSRATVALNVSTVESHPGKTLAGCSYRIEIN